jgi:hypothetical protein
MLSRLAGRPVCRIRKPIPRVQQLKAEAATPTWNKWRFRDIIVTGGIEEEEPAMSTMLEHFTLFDFFILAALVGILCCGLLDGETT